MGKNARKGLYDSPIQSVEYQMQIADQDYKEALNTEVQTALGLLASAYGNSSDSEEDQVHPDKGGGNGESNVTNHSSGSKSQSEISSLPSGNHQTFDYAVGSKDYNITSGVAFKNMRAVPHSTLNCSQDVQDAERLMFGKGRVPIDAKNIPIVPQSDEDSSRMHVFCLEHAAEVKQQLCQIGGAHILLLCHPGLVFD